MCLVNNNSLSEHAKLIDAIAMVERKTNTMLDSSSGEESDGDQPTAMTNDFVSQMKSIVASSLPVAVA